MDLSILEQIVQRQSIQVLFTFHFTSPFRGCPEDRSERPIGINWGALKPHTLSWASASKTQAFDDYQSLYSVTGL